MARSSLSFLAAALVAAACSLPVPVSAGQVVQRDGTSCTLNGVTPAEPRRTLTLRESWRISSEEEDRFLLGTIKDVAATDDGTLLLLDQQLAQVHLISPAGDYLRSVGRQGDGPGESRQPMGVVLAPGGAIAVLEAFPPRLVCVDREGRPLPPIELRAAGESMATNSFALSVAAGPGTIAYSGRTFTRGPESGRQPANRLVLCNPDGTERRKIIEIEREDMMTSGKYDEKAEYFPHGRRWALGPDDRVYVAPVYDAYRVHVYGPDGQLERIFEREYEPRLRSAAEKEGRGVHMNANGREIPIQSIIADHDPCISELRVTSAGEVWVLHSRSERDLPPGIVRLYDVFDAQGHYVREVALSAAIDRAEDDQLFHLADDQAVLIRGFDRSLSISIGGGGDGHAAPEEDRPPMVVIGYAVEG